MQNFPKIPDNWKDDYLFEKWNKFKIIKKVVNAAIEEKRASKEIGSSLEANVQIYLNEDYLKVVENFNLSENFITSKSEAKKMINNNNLFILNGDESIKVSVKKADGDKCPRCWKIFPHPCQRCNQHK